MIDTPEDAPPTPTRTRRDRTSPSLDDLTSRASVDPDLSELEHTRLRATGPDRPQTTGLRLLFDTGEQIDVTGDGLVGRNPGPEPSADHVVAIDDPERSISKVHLAFGLEADGRLWVMDRGSTNGHGRRRSGRALGGAGGGSAGPRSRPGGSSGSAGDRCRSRSGSEGGVATGRTGYADVDSRRAAPHADGPEGRR